MESVSPWGPLISLCNAACSVQRRLLQPPGLCLLHWCVIKILLLLHQQAKVLTSIQMSKSLEPCLGNNLGGAITEILCGKIMTSYA